MPSRGEGGATFWLKGGYSVQLQATEHVTEVTTVGMGLPPGFQQDGEELMRPAILIGSDKTLTSALVSDATKAELKLGMKLQVTEPIDLAPHGVIEAGEQGVVAHVDPVNGLVEIKLELMHWGLSEWQNCMWLLPFGTEDILHKIACVVGNECFMASIV